LQMPEARGYHSPRPTRNGNGLGDLPRDAAVRRDGALGCVVFGGGTPLVHLNETRRDEFQPGEEPGDLVAGPQRLRRGDVLVIDALPFGLRRADVERGMRDHHTLTVPGSAVTCLYACQIHVVGGMAGNAFIARGRCA
jgi:hypothetical protein